MDSPQGASGLGVNLPPPQCQAIKADRSLCTKSSTRTADDTHPEHLHFCGTHKHTYHRSVTQTEGVHHVAGQCCQIVWGPWGGMPVRRIKQWCPHPAAPGAPYCAAHEETRQQYLAAHPAEQVNEVLQALVEGMVAQDPPVPWQTATRLLAGAIEIPLRIRRRAALRYYHLDRTRQLDAGWPHGPVWRFNAYWMWALDGAQGPPPNVDLPPPPPPPGLGALARDGQNVHTAVVTHQTNSATDKLLAVIVPDTQQTERTLALVWLGGIKVPYPTFLRVATDINRWFNTKDCRMPDDNLYRKLLRGLVALITSEKDDERKMELYRRAWEECTEATGMCCEGHISRLCNVLVGFDEAFLPPVPFGEILQSKMAAIAGLDISDEEKRRQANAFFDEHGTPQEERVAWLEAF